MELYICVKFTVPMGTAQKSSSRIIEGKAEGAG